MKTKNIHTLRICAGKFTCASSTATARLVPCGRLHASNRGRGQHGSVFATTVRLCRDEAPQARIREAALSHSTCFLPRLPFTVRRSAKTRAVPRSSTYSTGSITHTGYILDILVTTKHPVFRYFFKTRSRTNNALQICWKLPVTLPVVQYTG